ncbi:hypothetical protein [Alterinioella nitratireducens]|uniref:hypothetical protein n=1 Tax=Alterinioella nitratireducens TaxID=2735915 RepID=UPI00405830F2
MTDEPPQPSAPSAHTSPRRRARQCNADYRWTVPKVQAFLRALEQCGRVAEAARAVGMSRQAAYALRARLDGPAFREAFEGARRTGLRARAAASRARLEAQRSPWEGPGLEALDYLRAGASQADTRHAQADNSGGQAVTRPAQADADMRHADACRPQADADRHKPTSFAPGQCNTRSMSRPASRRGGG